MDLKGRLGRLGAPLPSSGAAPGPGTDGTDRGADAAPARPASLSDLRRQMAEILGRASPPRPSPPPEPDLGELPFVREDTPAGPVHRRLLRLAPSHHVGRIPVDAARTADRRVLALLALDPELAAPDPARALYLDTETTGLGGAGTVAFLVGLAFFDEDGVLSVEQLMLRTPSEEPALLAWIASRVESSALVVTFNGKAFDLPTLSGRYVMNRMAQPPARPHLDLLHVARRLHRTRLGACNLKSVESWVLGFERDADIDGGDVAPRYGHFLRSGDPTTLVPVVEHNCWDVVSMAALVGLYGEPLGTLHGEDLVGLARTYRRARALDEADRAAEAAVERGAGAEGLRVRGEVAKARGDRRRALEDFEALSRTVDDPRVRLELSKLYEHFAGNPELALAVAEQGTAERPDAARRRRERLERKVARRRGDE